MRKLLGILGGCLVRLLYVTIRVRVHGAIPSEPGVIAFWHGHQLCLYGGVPQGPKVAPVSLSKDGQIQTGVLSVFGIGSVRGSSSRGGTRALLGLARALRKGAIALIAVDGPRGPNGVAKDGAFYVSKRLNLPIWPVVGHCSNAWVISRAWDKMRVPKPFSRVDVRFGPALKPQGSLSHAELKERFMVAIAKLSANNEGRGDVE